MLCIEVDLVTCSEVAVSSLKCNTECEFVSLK